MNSKQPTGFNEFVLMLAAIISLVALSIDAILPALSNIASDFELSSHNESQWVIAVLFLSMSFSSLFYGPLSDSIGRKKTIHLGFCIFIIGSLICLLSESFRWLLVGRFIQGLGAGGPKVVVLALVRDLYQGKQMAKIMSVIMTAFIFVPALAPVIGQSILLNFHWKMIFLFFLVYAIVVFIWYQFRLNETLEQKNKRAFSIIIIWQGIKEVINTKTSLIYTIITGFTYGAFLSYLNSAQHLFQTIYNTGELFAFYFALLAIAIGLASYFNAKLVNRWGLKRLCVSALISIVLFSIIAMVIHGFATLSFIIFMIYLCCTFFCMGMLFGNLNSLAMEPLGHLAGTGAAVIGSLSMLFSVPIGLLVSMQINLSVLPLLIGFLLLSCLSLWLLWLID